MYIYIYIYTVSSSVISIFNIQLLYYLNPGIIMPTVLFTYCVLLLLHLTKFMYTKTVVERRPNNQTVIIIIYYLFFIVGKKEERDDV